VRPVAPGVGSNRDVACHAADNSGLEEVHEPRRLLPGDGLAAEIREPLGPKRRYSLISSQSELAGLTDPAEAPYGHRSASSARHLASWRDCSLPSRSAVKCASYVTASVTVRGLSGSRLSQTEATAVSIPALGSSMMMPSGGGTAAASTSRSSRHYPPGYTFVARPCSAVGSGEPEGEPTATDAERRKPTRPTVSAARWLIRPRLAT